MELKIFFDLNDPELNFYKSEIEKVTIIREKDSAVNFLIKAIKLILYYPEKIKEGESNKEGTLQIFIEDRVKRVFYISDSKITSVFFTFYITKGTNYEYIIKFLDIKIDPKKLTYIEMIIENRDLFNNSKTMQSILDWLSIIESYLEKFLSDFSPNDKSMLVEEIMKLYINLLILEDGYIRFEDDPGRAEELHPRGLSIHLCKFYYSLGTVHPFV